MKKMISLILALVMVLGLAVSASAASITINPNLPEGTSSTGETYKAYKIFDATFADPLTADSAVSYTIDSGNPFYSVISSNTAFKLTQVNDTTTYNVEKVSDFDASTLAAALNAVISDSTPVAGSASTANAEGNYVINVQDKGYYLITSTVGSALIVDTLGDIEITTKNSYPSVEKKADKTTAAFGETVTYTLTINVPATAVGNITVHDTMTGLTYNNDAEAKADNADVVLNVKTGDENTHCTVEMIFDATAVAGKTVTITYSAKVNANTVETNNKANIEYGKFTSTDVQTSTKNYKIDVYKYTGTDNARTGLAGAGFVLKNADGKYYKLTGGIVSWVDSIEEASAYVTAAETYIVTFEGLANGTYTLEEKSVPAGYNKANDVKVTIEDADKTGTTQVEVLNQTGSELPSTGGMGTTLFYVVGGLLMAGAAVLLITKKRMA